MNVINSLRTSLLWYCLPRKTWEIVVLAATCLIAVILFIYSFLAHLENPNPHAVIISTAFILLVLSEPFGHLSRITRTLRFLKFPGATRALFRLSSILALSWLIVCVLFFSFEGAQGLIHIIALTGMLVLIYAEALSSPSSALNNMGLPIIYFMALRNGWLTTGFIPFVIILGFFHLKRARLVWQNLELGLAAPRAVDFNATSSRGADFVTRPANLEAELGDEHWPNMLRYFGLVNLRTHSIFVAKILLIGAAIAGIVYAGVTRGTMTSFWFAIILLAVSITFLTQVEHQFLGIYACKKEREFLVTLPGLPSPEVQAKCLQVEFWQRLVISQFSLLAACSIAVITTTEPSTLYFFLTVCASTLIGASVVENKITHYSGSGQLESGSGLIGPLAIVAGLVVATFGIVTDYGGLAFLLTAALSLVALFSPRGNSTLALVKRE